MRSTSVLLLVIFFFLSFSFLNAQTTDEEIHAPDGGAIERLMSISVPPIAHAPFSSTVNTEWVKELSDGTTITVQNHRNVIRDAAGRIYQERATFVPKNGTKQSAVWRFEISDPVAHVRYMCFPEAKTCSVSRYFAAPDSVKMAVQPAGPLDANGDRNLTRESMGTNNISGIDVTGTCETTTINSGVIGNDKPISIVKEIWFSAKLDLNISVKRVDPRHGTEDFLVSNISTTEPDPKYFSVPSNYSIDDHLLKQTTALRPAPTN
jgi:hypothetical protein